LLVTSIPLTIVCGFVAFFPYSIVTGMFFEDVLGLNTGDAAVMLPMLVQFPLYAVILVWAGRRGRFTRALIALAAAHVLLAAVQLLM